MKHKKALISLLTITAISSTASAVSFLDDFSADTSANYTGTNTFGSGGSFTVSGDNLNVAAVASNTYTVFNNTAVFDIGDTLSIDTIANADVDIRLSVSTAAVGPNFGSNNGVRLKRDRGDGSFDFQAYGGGTTTFSNALVASAGSSLTLFLTRETANTFSAAFDAGSGLIQLNTTGGTEKESLAVTGLTSATLFIGVEAFGDSASFDNLQVTPVPEASALVLLGLSGIALLVRRRR